MCMHDIKSYYFETKLVNYEIICVCMIIHTWKGGNKSIVKHVHRLESLRLIHVNWTTPIYDILFREKKKVKITELKVLCLSHSSAIQ